LFFKTNCAAYEPVKKLTLGKRAAFYLPYIETLKSKKLSRYFGVSFLAGQSFSFHLIFMEFLPHSYLKIVTLFRKSQKNIDKKAEIYKEFHLISDE